MDEQEEPSFVGRGRFEENCSCGSLGHENRLDNTYSTYVRSGAFYSFETLVATAMMYRFQFVRKLLHAVDDPTQRRYLQFPGPRKSKLMSPVPDWEKMLAQKKKE
jgi:hypothetical protein